MPADLPAEINERLSIPRIAAPHLLTDLDLTTAELRDLLRLAVRVKAAPEEYAEALKRRNIAVVFEKLFKARAGDANELELHLLRSSRDPAPLYNILLTAPCRLRHLLDHAVLARQEPAAESNRAVVDDLAQQVAP